VLNPKRQKEIMEFAARIKSYNPDVIMVEELPEIQKRVDSLYTLYHQNKLDITEWKDGEVKFYQIAFRIGKQLKLNKSIVLMHPVELHKAFWIMAII
jgi:hypothetical protein